ncbi:MAG: DUF2207 domain-containing protein [Candidatus Atribacteria bacterium]|nr:DUF2207 domain-containing protein [Candidatus Atribacteria bacterium]
MTLGFILLIIIIIFSFTNLLIYAERSFEITDYQAQVKILENGDIQVSEIFEYNFDGDFNGIIRTIGMKGSDGLQYFKASEYFPTDKELNYDQSTTGDMVTYKIYDQSSNERKLFLLEYQLNNVATLYNDTAEFYWKFFDQSNTSPIGHIKIEVELPSAEVSAEELKVFGHGPLAGKVSIREDGRIVYEVDGLSPGEMVEARILFPTRMIPDSSKIINQNKFAEIMKEELGWAKKADLEKSRGMIFNILGILLIPLIILFNIFFAIRLYFKYDKELKPEVEMDYYRELPQDITPAVLSKLMSIQGVGSKDIMATLMDLVRKKFLKIEEIQSGRKKEYKFILIESESSNLKEHEAYLIHWLFSSIGNGASVTLKEIEDYAKSSRTQRSFVHDYNNWAKKVGQEFKKYNYFGESKEGLKAAVKVIFLELGAIFLLLVLGILFRVQWFIFIPLLFIAGFTGFGVITYSALIRKKTQTGVNEYTKWRAFKQFLLHFSNMKDYEIPSIVVWEHYLVYAISLGVADKVISKLKLVLSNQDISLTNSTYLYTMTDSSGRLNSSMFKSFDTVFSSAFASTSTGSSTGSGGGFSSGGGGGGGGGGGAGAF